jgi:hypothetical protein
MTIIRKRFDQISAIKNSSGDSFGKAEMVAFHGRKIVEGIAFGCLVAIKNGLKHIPRESEGQWNAEKILLSLQSRNLGAFPSPSDIRNANDDEKKLMPELKVTIEGKPERRLTPSELIGIYREFHKWLHEINPYVGEGREVFMRKHEQRIWTGLEKLYFFIERHVMSIGGQGFYCTLRDKIDGATKVSPLSKVASLYPRNADTLTERWKRP